MELKKVNTSDRKFKGSTVKGLTSLYRVLPHIVKSLDRNGTPTAENIAQTP
uniref:Uncharacterized protein n=1 Tax=Arion vulgaris TaxID=1028688 RepID=A0A0B7AU73_9EUPU